MQTASWWERVWIGAGAIGLARVTKQNVSFGNRFRSSCVGRLGFGALVRFGEGVHLNLGRVFGHVLALFFVWFGIAAAHARFAGRRGGYDRESACFKKKKTRESSFFESASAGPSVARLGIRHRNRGGMEIHPGFDVGMKRVPKG